MNFDNEIEFFKGCFPVFDLKEVNYNVFRSGKRLIYVPSAKLKKAQRYLKKEINKEYPLKISTFNSAKIHSGQKWVLKMDIKDFYGSVRYEDIQRVIKSLWLCNSLEVIQYLTDLVTVGKKLPTGAPTSAHIANASFLPLDKRIREFCDIRKVNYSRYMDDLTFSGSDKKVLNSVELFVSDIVSERGFRVNNKKTRYISDNKQQNVLGLVVNEEVRTPKSLRRRIRAMLHSYAVYCGNYVPRDTDCEKFREDDIVRLNGYLHYLASVDKKSYDKLVEYSKKFVSLPKIYFF